MLILVDEVQGLPVVLGTSNVVSNGVEVSGCGPGGLRHLPDHHVFADESDQSPGGSKAGRGRAAVFGRGRGGVV